MPEALRIKGEILFSSDRADANLAEEHFRRSLDIANRQGALSWELRSAMSLGRLYHAQGRIRDAHDRLGLCQVYRGLWDGRSSVRKTAA